MDLLSVDQERDQATASRLGWLTSHPTVTTISGIGALALIGVVHFVTGPHVSGSLFYLLPILFVTHFAGQTAGYITATTATLIWLAQDLIGANVGWISFWNATMRFSVFVVVVWLLSSVRTLAKTLDSRVRERTKALRNETRERLTLEKRILEISEREQARIGQDLHDGLCQHLVGTTFSANILQQKLAARGAPETTEASRIAGQLDDAITQARELCRGLYPVRLEEEGLVNALQDLVNIMSERFGAACRLETAGSLDDLDISLSIHLYRIAQEAINNAVKHATPRNITVTLTHDGSRGILRVENDGGTFHSRHPSSGMGLHIMRYRARMIGGDLAVQPLPEGGTCVICEFGISPGPDGPREP